jgi:hypothetical protein
MRDRHHANDTSHLEERLHGFALSTYVRIARSPWKAWARPGVMTNLAGPFFWL